jgi:hypothetical protein
MDIVVVVVFMDSSSHGQRQHLDLLRSHVNESVNLLLFSAYQYWIIEMLVF